MNHFILSDSRKCIGCQACEVACVMAHNEEQHVLTPQRFLPRITVIKAEGQRNAITCRHCEDAPCVRSCPNDAIAQSGDSVQVRQEKCIGCKSCMVACPFGVMQVVVTPQAAGLVKASAHKCDLCQGREAGPACVENCPAQALTLADDETLITLAKQRRLRSACQEVQPWQRATPLCSQPNAGAKVRQMAMTPPRGEPDKLAAEVRKSHFEEIYQPFTPQQAQQQQPPAVSRVGSTVFANGPARCITISRSGSSWLKRGISPPRGRAFPSDQLPAGDHRPRLSPGPAV